MKKTLDSMDHCQKPCDQYCSLVVSYSTMVVREQPTGLLILYSVFHCNLHCHLVINQIVVLLSGMLLEIVSATAAVANEIHFL